MPDPDDLFASFRDEGAPVNPLPAAEVRRRGDRLRRRNTRMAAVGGVAAALVIATPFAVLAGRGSDSSAPDPAPAPSPAPSVRVDWPQQIPADFEVRAGMVGDPVTPPQDTSAPGVATIEVCDSVAFSATTGTVDVRGAHYEPAEATDQLADRTLALYADDADAAESYDRLVDAVEQCRSEAPNEVGDVYDWGRTGLGLDADQAALITRSQIPEGNSSPVLVDYYIVARTGNALLVTHTAGAPSPELATAQESEAEQVVEAMLRFSAAENSAPDPATQLPDDLPIDTGLAPAGATTPVVVTDDLGVDGLLSLSLCRREVWTYRDEYIADALAASWSDGVAGGEFRTAVSYQVGEPAESAFGTIAHQVATCADVTALDVTAGDEATAYVDAGGTVYVVVRVGDALLLLQRHAEGAPQASADDLLDRAAPVLEALDAG